MRGFTLNANRVYTEYVNSRRMPGGGLCVLDLHPGAVREIVPGLTEGVVNRFDLSQDGSKIMFDYKKSVDSGGTLDGLVKLRSTGEGKSRREIRITGKLAKSSTPGM